MNEESVQVKSIQAEQPAAERRAARARTILDYLKTVLVTLLVALTLKSFVVEAFRIPSSSMEGTLLVGDFLLVNKLAYGIRTPRFIPLTNLTITTFYAPVFRSVKWGNVVVFEFPAALDALDHDEPVNYIKRCIGLPGDVVEIQRGQLFVNGEPMGLPKHAHQGDPNASHHPSRLFPWGVGFTENQYGPLTVPKEGDEIEITEANFSMWRSLIMREGHKAEFDQRGGIMIDGKPAQHYRVQQNYYFVMGDNRENSLDSRYWGFVPEKNLIGEALVVYWSWDPDVAVSDLWDKLKSIRWDRIGTLIR